MNKLLIIALLALPISFAHAGSCGDKTDKDEQGDKSGAVPPSQSLACDQKSDVDKKNGTDESGYSSESFEFAGNCSKGRDSDETAKDKG